MQRFLCYRQGGGKVATPEKKCARNFYSLRPMLSMYPLHTGATMRRLTDAERDLMNHINMWGSAGYPIRKLGAGRWVWGTDYVKGPPTVFKTKAAAVESFDGWRRLMRQYLGEEAKERAIADLRARGWTEEEIQAAVDAANAREAAKHAA